MANSRYIVCLIVCATFGLVAQRTEAQSFDCKKASTVVEKAVCSNATVSGLDQRLAQTVKQLLARHPEWGNQLLRNERLWVKFRNLECTKFGDEPVYIDFCLTAVYTARLTALESTTPLQEPPVADAPVSADQEKIVTSEVQNFIAAIRDKGCVNVQVGPLDPKDVHIHKPYVRGGSSEYIVWLERDDCGYCSPTGNCAFWVLAPKGQSFEILLKGVSGGSPDVLESVSHGRPDLVVSTNDSAARSVDETYQFDGQKYRQAKCVYTNYADGKTTPCE